MAIPRSLIVYFSQGGGNARIAEAIATGLKRAGYHVDLWNLRNGRPPDPRGYQLFGVGSPVYYYHVPVNIAYYVEHLCPGSAPVRQIYRLEDRRISGSS